MPFPKISDGRVDPILSNVLLAYTNPNYVAERILPTVPGLKDESGKIAQMGNSHLRVYSSKRALYDESEHRINYTINHDNTYSIDYYDKSAYIPDRLQEQLQKPFDAKQAGMFTVMNALMLEREAALAAQLTSTAVLTNQSTPANLYTDVVNSTPLVDFDTARDSVQSKTGQEANCVFMSRAVANTLRRHPDILEIAHSALQGGSSKDKALSEDGLITTLKAWYGLSDVIIGKQIYVNSKEGQTETKTAVWGNDIVWFYRPSAPSLFETSFGYSFQLTGYNRQTRIRRHTEDKGDIVECMWAYQDNILDVNAAYLQKTVI